MFSDIFCVHKKTFESLNRSDSQVPHRSPKCQVRKKSFDKQTNWFFLKFGQGIFIFEETQKSNQVVIGDVHCPTSPCGNCVHLSTNKTTNFYDCKKSKACSRVLKIPFGPQKRKIMLVGGDGKHCFARKVSRDYKKDKTYPLLQKFRRQSESSTPEHEQKKPRNIPCMA